MWLAAHMKLAWGVVRLNNLDTVSKPNSTSIHIGSTTRMQKLYRFHDPNAEAM